MANNITTVVNYQVSQAIKALQDTQAELGKTEISGDDLAAALSKGAADAAAELDKIKAAAAAMETSLGEDFVQARAAAGVSVDDIVMELNRLGASFDEIAMHSDKLASSVRQLDDVQAPMRRLRPAADDAADGLDRVARSGDQSRSVLANMAGNSVQDLGALGGVAGTAGVALGQLAEYAADGNIPLGKMAGLGLGLAGVGTALWAINKGAEQSAQHLADMEAALAQVGSAADEMVGRKLLEAYTGWLLSGAKGADPIQQLANEDLPALKRAFDILTSSGALSAQAQEHWASVIAEADRAAAQAAETQREYGDATDASTSAAERLGRALTAAATDAASAGSIQARKTEELTQRLGDYLAMAEGIPAELYSDIKAALNAGDLARAEALLNEVARSRIVQVGIAINSGAAAGAAVGAGKLVGNAVSDAISAAIAGTKMPSSVTGGAGGGGGGGASPAETEAQKWDDAVEKLLAYGKLSREQAMTYYEEQMAAEDELSDRRLALFNKLQGLRNQVTAEDERRRKEEEKAAKDAADAAEKRAEQQLSTLEKIANILSDLKDEQYGNLEGAPGPSNTYGAGGLNIDPSGFVAWLAEQLRGYQEGLT